MIIAAVAVLFALPLIVFRARTLVNALALQIALYVFAFVVARQLGSFDRYLATVVLFVAQLALFSLLLSLAPAHEVRWSADRAAIVALLVYALMIPAMLRTPIDGDEPFYLLVTESIVHDRDLDLGNQYRDLAHSATKRTDLRPQFGDPAGKHGEQYSRTEPFLSFLLVPGYVIGKLDGSLAIIALFGALLVRSTIRLLEDEGIDNATARAVFPLFAFGPPVMFYATRIWPEVPGAFCFVEALRGVRQRRPQRWIPALFGLTLLKLRFILIAMPLLIATVRRRKHAIVAALAIAIPLAVVWLVSGSATNVHSLSELLPGNPRAYFHGLFGLILDGAAGITFQAPFYLLALFAITFWRTTPAAFRLGLFASSLYILYLIPRGEWYGGWSPPLRYIVVFTPVFGLGAAAVWKRVNRGVIAVISIWTVGLVAHGATYPYRLFHIANGENAIGEWLSALYRTDFSRLIPSLIRVNDAAIVATIALIVAFAIFRFVRVPASIAIALVAVALAAFFVEGQKPGRVVQFEDAHVVHDGGDLYPELYQVGRFLFRGGWILHSSESVSFVSRGGNAKLEYQSGAPALIQIGTTAYHLDATGKMYGATVIEVPRGRVTLRCAAGAVNLDKLTF